MRRDILIGLALAIATLAVYWPVGGYPFVNYDDPGYVSQNAQTQQGLTRDNVRWAFTTGRLANWHPLTWLSHMTDCQLFGLNAGRHHLVNVALHILNAILLYLVWKWMTGAAWPSAAVAAFFALHPLHVESVAWVAERKDVLSTLLGLATIAAYVWYVRRPGILRYAAVFAGLALGLMVKPMLVTWPFVLLLLDVWPLGRLPLAPPAGQVRANLAALLRPAARLVAEKIPLILLAAASCVAAYVAQERGGAVMSADRLPLGLRGENALVACVAYLGKTLWPANLAVFYPHPGELPLWQWAGAALVLAAVTAAVVLMLRRRPYLAVGWFWFLGTLVPVIGLVQVGMQGMADRYTYVPLIGLFTAGAWGLADVAARRTGRRIGIVSAAAAALVACAAITSVQVGYWQSSHTLFSHALAITRDNFVAHNNLGMDWAQDGNDDRAIDEYRKALEIAPTYSDAMNNLGNALGRKGRFDEAEALFRGILGADPDMSAARYNLGNLLTRMRRYSEAAAEYRVAARLMPDDPQVFNNLGNALASAGKTDEAAAAYREALRLNPGHAKAAYNLGAILMDVGRFAEAAPYLAEAIRLQPDYAKAVRRLGMIRAAAPDANLRSASEAIRLAEQALTLAGPAHRDAESMDVLAAAYAESGRFEEAAARANEAARLARAMGQQDLAARIEARAALYRAGQPYRLGMQP